MVPQNGPFWPTPPGGHRGPSNLPGQRPKPLEAGIFMRYQKADYIMKSVEGRDAR